MSRRQRRSSGFLSVRDMTQADVEAVWELWAGYISEGFARSLRIRGHRRNAMSLDRWGPGIAVPFDASEAPLEQAVEPGLAIRRYLSQLPDAPAASAIVAEAGDGTLVGFVTYSLRAHPVLPGMAGHVDDIYAQPGATRHLIHSTLVDAVTNQLAEFDANGIECRLPHGPQARSLRRAYRRAGWEMSGEWMSYWQ